jgi:hypothetical protein
MEYSCAGMIKPKFLYPIFYQVQPKAVNACLAASKACLQLVAITALACESALAAPSFHALRDASKADLDAPRDASGILLRQASIFSIYSSHSATPILSPVEDDVVVVELEPPQPAKTNTPQSKVALNKKCLFNLIIDGFLSSNLKVSFLAAYNRQ